MFEDISIDMEQKYRYQNRGVVFGAEDKMPL